MKFTNNVGKDDRIIRTLVGLGFISMVFIGPETAWGWFGLVPLLTAVVGFCPLYTKLSLDTSDPKEDDEKASEELPGSVAKAESVEVDDSLKPNASA